MADAPQRPQIPPIWGLCCAELPQHLHRTVAISHLCQTLTVCVAHLRTARAVTCHKTPPYWLQAQARLQTTLKLLRQCSTPDNHKCIHMYRELPGSSRKGRTTPKLYRSDFSLHSRPSSISGAHHANVPAAHAIAAWCPSSAMESLRELCMTCTVRAPWQCMRLAMHVPSAEPVPTCTALILRR